MLVKFRYEACGVRQEIKSKINYTTASTENNINIKY